MKEMLPWQKYLCSSTDSKTLKSSKNEVGMMIYANGGNRVEQSRTHDSPARSVHVDMSRIESRGQDTLQSQCCLCSNVEGSRALGPS